MAKRVEKEVSLSERSVLILILDFQVPSAYPAMCGTQRQIKKNQTTIQTRFDYKRKLV